MTYAWIQEQSADYCVTLLWAVLSVISILSNQLAQQELQWSPRVSMMDGIYRTAQWLGQELAKDD